MILPESTRLEALMNWRPSPRPKPGPKKPNWSSASLETGGLP